MRIQHNITALNAANRLKANENTVAKNIQKLSSGYRINSAADDAAGLAVSEKMREQISGLTQAEDNTKNGISLVQTAEGGLNETSAILQRMNTLATESANGTYQNKDRSNLQTEVKHLKTEIDRIASSTKFNEISLLDGSLSATGSASITMSDSLATTMAKTGLTSSISTFSALDVTKFTTAADSTITYTVSYKDQNNATQTANVTLTWTKANSEINGVTVAGGTGTDAAAKDIGKAISDALGSVTGFKSGSDQLFTVAADSSTGDLTFTSKVAGSATEVTGITANNGVSAPTANITHGTDTNAFDFSGQKVYSHADATSYNAAVFDINGKKFAFAASGETGMKADLGADVDVVTLSSGSTITATDVSKMATEIASKTGLTAAGITGTKMSIAAPAGKALVFQVGAENSDEQRASLNIDDMNSDSLGLKDLDISTQDGANAALDTIKSAIAQVSSQRSELGGLQNELEHTANNLGTMNENLSSAESTIRDVDMTDEYVQYSKNQILSQAANAMLAQANTQPQNVLSLLKG